MRDCESRRRSLTLFVRQPGTREVSMKRVLILFLQFAFLFGTALPQRSDPGIRPLGLVRIDSIGPIEFLDSLRKMPQTICTVIPRNDWVKQFHIPIFLALLDSRDSCPNVTSMLSSFWDNHKSTIGREAAFLILGFRRGKYPPLGNSIQMKWTKSEILQWWKEWRQLNGLE